MECALTFGAVGDFLSIALLIKDIVSALDDYRGSVKEYQDLVNGLVILQETVHEVAKVYSDEKLPSGVSDLSPIALRNIQQIQQCLAGFRDQIRKYGPSLAERGTGNVFKDVVRKVQWKLEEKDVNKFRAELIGHNMSLKVLLEVTAVRIIQHNHEISTKQVSEAENRMTSAIRRSGASWKGFLSVVGKRILSKLDYVSRLGTEMSRTTSQILSMMYVVSGELSSIRGVVLRLDRGVSDEHFILEDATGRIFPIHLKTITSWDAFEYILNDRFKGKKGAHRIRRKLYSLQERATRRDVDQSIEWEYAFLPHQRVDMSVICREGSKKMDEKPTSSCPWCHTLSPGETNLQVQCRNCNLYFTRVFEVDDDDEVLPPVPDPQERSIDVQSGKSAFNMATQRQRDVDNDTDNRYSNNQKLKFAKLQESENRKSYDEELQSESDDEDFRGFVRIILTSKRRRIQTSKAPFQATDADSFDSKARKIMGNKTSFSFKSATNTGVDLDDNGAQSMSDTMLRENASLQHLTSAWRSNEDLQASDAEAENSNDDIESDKDELGSAEKVESTGWYTYVSEPGSTAEARKRPANYTYWSPYHSPETQSTTKSKVHIARQATENDARKHGILPGYILKHWDPDEEPVILMGSVFDANSIGKWIFDWATYHYGRSSPCSDMAGELSLLLIMFAGKTKRMEESVLRIRSLAKREMLENFLERGERIMDKFRKLLRACEAPMLAAKRATRKRLGKASGIAFIETLFGKDHMLEQTERFMQMTRLWGMRFDANCEDILKHPTQ